METNGKLVSGIRNSVVLTASGIVGAELYRASPIFSVVGLCAHIFMIYQSTDEDNRCSDECKNIILVGSTGYVIGTLFGAFLFRDGV